MSGQSHLRRVCFLTIASLSLGASDVAVARNEHKGERAHHEARTKGVAAIPRPGRIRGERSGPHPLVIRPYASHDYLCPRPDDFSKRCVTVRTTPVELSGPGSSATSLGSSVLQPPQVPPVDYNQAPATMALGRSLTTIRAPNSPPSPIAALATQQQTLAIPQLP